MSRILLSLDIDGTIEVGDPPGVLTMEMIRTTVGKGFIVVDGLKIAAGPLIPHDIGTADRSQMQSGTQATARLNLVPCEGGAPSHGGTPEPA